MFARDALRMAIATERSGLEFYTRAAGLTKDPRGRSVFQKLAAEEREHLGTLEKRYRELIAGDPQLESRPTFLFFKGAASGLFAEGAKQLREGVNDQEALLIGIKCERGSHQFFKKYGERFEDSEGKQVFLEFADEEREHLELLMREYRALRERQKKPSHAPRAAPGARAPMIDLHTHTTASDGRCTPAELVARAARGRRDGAERHRPRHGRRLRGGGRGLRARPGSRSCPASRSPPSATEVDVHVLGYFIDPQSPALRVFLAEQRQRRIDRVGRIVVQLETLGLHLDADAILRPAIEQPGKSIGRPAIARALVAAGYVKTTNEAFASWLSRGRPAFVAREGAAPETVIAQIHDAGGIASLAHPGLLRRDEWIAGFASAGLDAHRGVSHESRRGGDRPLPLGRAPPRASRSPAAPTTTPTSRTARRTRAACRCRREAFDQLRDRATSRATASGAGRPLRRTAPRSRRSDRRSSSGLEQMIRRRRRPARARAALRRERLVDHHAAGRDRRAQIAKQIALQVAADDDEIESPARQRMPRQVGAPAVRRAGLRVAPPRSPRAPHRASRRRRTSRSRRAPAPRAWRPRPIATSSARRRPAALARDPLDPFDDERGR